MIHLYVAKQGGYVGFGSGQMDHGSKRVIFKQVNWVAGRVYQYFSNKFFFLGLVHEEENSKGHDALKVRLTRVGTHRFNK